MPKIKESPSTSRAAGAKLYRIPTAIALGGAPEIVGARLPVESERLGEPEVGDSGEDAPPPPQPFNSDRPAASAIAEKIARRRKFGTKASPTGEPVLIHTLLSSSSGR
jgi:hypothetical protein